MRGCPSGKIIYTSIAMAEDALIDLWSKSEYTAGKGPVAIYKCEDCGLYHFTSKGPMNEALDKALTSGYIQKQREAYRWEQKLKRR